LFLFAPGNVQESLLYDPRKQLVTPYQLMPVSGLSLVEVNFDDTILN
jgi:hypothetical protein